ncbi:MAG: MerR family transcriptional regulator [Veillonella sp.]|uniref:MerR family transcriptional regulator n=1 Tax=Veillonella sp. TaxID=1926307 RepID=UPI0025E8E6F4|nr:MerR family transcriptional regulator [Veillonella sp.]MBS4913835.1 MerR family transcriptional regulator [Veillonella sp.]
MREDLINISEMAKLHSLTRPTLLYYDSIGLFSPIVVDEANGYRYYGRHQIPVLREICFLKSIGVSLKDIKAHLEKRNLADEVALLQKQEGKLAELKAQLEKKQLALQQRLYLYREATAASNHPQEGPFLRHYMERRVIFRSWSEEGSDIDREDIHLASMQLWRELYEHEFLPAYSYGMLFKYQSVVSGEPLKGGASYIRIPPRSGPFEAEELVLPEGNYICQYKTGRPNDMTHLMELLKWIKEHGYEVCGDVVDACFLDTTFDDLEHDVLFSMLQVPVKEA